MPDVGEQFTGDVLNVRECLIEGADMTEAQSYVFVLNHGQRDVSEAHMRVIRAGIKALSALSIVRVNWRKAQGRKI